MFPGIRHHFLLLALLGSLFVVACTDSRTAGGNSAETGNPEIAGVLTFADGRPARAARVRCVPSGFNALTDSLDAFRSTRSDSTGAFHFDSLPAGSCALEAVHDSSGMRMLLPALVLDSGERVVATGVLGAPVSLRIGTGNLPDGSAGHVVVHGTTIAQSVVVKFSSVFVDSLPPGTLDSVFFVGADQVSRLLATDVVLPAGSTVEVSAAPVRYDLQLPVPTGSQGIALKDTLYGFPLLLRLDSARADARFISANTPLKIFVGSDSSRLLPFRITRWDRAGADIWVRLDTLLPGNDQQSLTLRWDAAAKPASVSGLPFANSDHFVAAWHFDEGSQYVMDAGSLGFDGRPFAVSSQKAIVGQGLWFDGSKSYVSIPGTATGPFDITTSDTMTFSLWARLDAPNTSRFVFGKGGYQFHLKYQHPANWLYESRDDASLTGRSMITTSFDTIADGGVWQFLTVVQSGSAISIYRDGSLVSSAWAASNSSGTKDRSFTFEIGRFLKSDDTYGQVFWGIIDEMQVSNTARSAEWIRAAWLNQRPSGFWP